MVDERGEDFYRSKLALIRGKEGAFVTFTAAKPSQFIQFAAEKDSGLFFADIPSREVNSDQPSTEQIESYFPSFERSEGPYGTDYCRNCDLEEALDFTQRFFSEVAELPDGFELEVNLHLGETTCIVCQSEKVGGDIEVVETGADQMRDAGVPEDRIQEEMGVMVDLWKDELATEGDYSDSELEVAARELAEDVFFAPVCDDCYENI